MFKGKSIQYAAGKMILGNPRIFLRAEWYETDNALKFREHLVRFTLSSEA